MPRRRRFGPTQGAGDPERIPGRFGHAGKPAVSSSVAKSDARAVRGRRFGSVLTFSFLIVIAFVYIFPFVIAIVASFKTEPIATS